MRILIYGAGAIGSIFAGKLALAGADITVLARGKRLNEIEENGIILKATYSTKHETIKVKVVDDLTDDDIYDYILVVMQKTQVDAVLPTLAKNSSPNIVFVVNNSLGYAEWANALGVDRLMIGFPSAGGERREGVVHYFIGRGISRAFQTTTFGELDGRSSGRLKALIGAFNAAGIPTVSSSNMDAWQKTHVAMVTSIGNALYKYNSDNYALAKATKDVRLMIEGIKEGLGVIKALGYKITPAKLNYYKLPTVLLSLMFKIIMSTKLAEVAMARHTVVARDEMRMLQKEFDSLILKAGLHTPAIDELRKYL